MAKISTPSQLFQFIRRAQEDQLDWNHVKKTIKGYPDAHRVRDADDKTILHLAAECGHKALTQLLATHRKFDVNALDRNHWTPLHCAASAGHLDVCQTLLNKSKDINANIKNDDENVPLAYLARLSEKQIKGKEELYQRVLEEMVKNGANVQATNGQGESILHLACMKGTHLSVRFLLEQGVDVNQRTLKRETPLHWAMRFPTMDVVRALMEYGADPYLGSENGATPMQAALESNKTSIVNLMSSHGRTCQEALSDYFHKGELQFYSRKFNSWKSMFGVVKDKILLLYQSQSDSERPIRSYNLSDAFAESVEQGKERHGAVYVFELRDEYRSDMFSVANDTQMRGWLMAIASRGIIRDDLGVERKEKDPSLISKELVVEKEKSLKRSPRTENIMESDDINGDLIRAMEDSGNSYCADCNARDATWLLVKYGALICYQCATIHNELNISQVKSVHYDSLLVSDSIQLKSVGNSNHNMKMESRATLSQKPCATSSVEDKRNYIQLKYAQARSGTTKRGDNITRNLDAEALFSRVTRFRSIYDLSQLLHALSLSENVWECLISTDLYSNIQQAVRKFDKQAALSEAVFQMPLKTVSGYAVKLLPSMFAFIEYLSLSRGSDGSAREEKLFQILQVYDSLQDEVHDSDVQIIFKWWLPQAAEVLAILRFARTLEADSILRSFINNSSKALYLLFGEYLVLESEPSDSRPTLEEQESVLREQCKEHTQTTRGLIKSAFQNQSKYNDGRSRPVIRADSADSHLRRTSSYTWSHTSTGDGSPRETSDSFLSEEISTEYPLITFIHQLPFATCKALCSIVYQFPEELQKSLLGLVSTGNSFLEIQGVSDMFSCCPVGMYEATSLIHSHAETLRKIWPESREQSEERKCELFLEDALLRQVFILRHHIRVMFGMPVLWVLPEVWNVWRSLQHICENVFHFLVCSAREHACRHQVSNVICWLIVQVRWTSTKLLEVQRVDTCAN